MLEYDRLGEMIDLFVMISWTGISSSGDEGQECVPSLPTKKQYHAGGMDLKCERVHEQLNEIRKDIEWVRMKNKPEVEKLQKRIGEDIKGVVEKHEYWLERNIGTN